MEICVNRTNLIVGLLVVLTLVVPLPAFATLVTVNWSASATPIYLAVLLLAMVRCQDRWALSTLQQ